MLKRYSSLIIALFCAAFFIYGCGQSVSTTTTTTTTTIPTYTISGTARFASTTDGVKGGVNISLTGTTNESATANTNTGTFEFTGLLAGGYTLEATYSGWATTSETVTLTATDETKNLSLYPTSWEVLNVDASKGGTLKDIDYSKGQLYYFAIGKENSQALILKADGTNLTSWAETSSPTTEPLIACFEGDSVAKSLYAVSRLATFYTSGDQGSTWALSSQLTFEAISRFGSHGVATTMEVITETSKTMYLSHDGFGTSSEQTPQAAGTGLSLNGICSTTDFKIYLVGDNGKARYSTDLGATWQTFSNLETLAGAENLMAIKNIANNFWVVSDAGAIYKSDDGGATWVKELSGVPYSLNGIYKDGSMVVGANRLILRRK